jgi:hypothetical protein
MIVSDTQECTILIRIPMTKTIKRNHQSEVDSMECDHHCVLLQYFDLKNKLLVRMWELLVQMLALHLQWVLTMVGKYSLGIHTISHVTGMRSRYGRYPNRSKVEVILKYV